MTLTVNVYFDGKPYSVPEDLTIMTATEYAGFSLVRGCGCRHGFCGACAVIYRISGKNQLHFALACQTQVVDGMHIASLPFFPLDKRTYSINDLQPTVNTLMQLFPETFACIACNSCTKSCSRSLNVMQYIAYAKRGDLPACARESFDCIACGICSARCPAGISHSLVGLLARRLTGKYLTPESTHTLIFVSNIAGGAYDNHIDEIIAKSPEELKEMYNSREIEI